MTQQISKLTNYTKQTWKYINVKEIQRKASKPHITPQSVMEEENLSLERKNLFPDHPSENLHQNEQLQNMDFKPSKPISPYVLQPSKLQLPTNSTSLFFFPQLPRVTTIEPLTKSHKRNQILIWLLTVPITFSQSQGPYLWMRKVFIESLSMQ